MEWHFDRVLGSYDLSAPREKQKAADELLIEIDRIPFAVEQDHWLRELAGHIGVSVQVLRDDLKRVPGEKKFVVRNEKEDTIEDNVELKHSSRFELLIERLLELLLRYPTEKADLANISDEMLSTTGFLPLYKAIEDQYNKQVHEINLDTLRAHVGTETKENIVDILLMKGELDFSHLELKDAKDEISSLVQSIVMQWKKDRRNFLQNAIAQAEKSGNTEQLNNLLKQFQSL